MAFVNDPPLVPNCENKFVVLKSKYVRDKVDDENLYIVGLKLYQIYDTTN